MHVTALPLLVELPVGQPAQIAVSITNTIVAHRRLLGAGVRPRPAVDARRPAAPVAVPVRGRHSSRSPSRCRADFPAGMRHDRRARAERERPDRVLAGPDRPRRRHPVAHDVARRPGHRHRRQLRPVRARSSPTRATPPCRRGPKASIPRTSSTSPSSPPTVVLPPGRREVVRADVTRRPAVVRPTQAAGPVVQPRPRLAAGDGDVRPAARASAAG